jgi:hypothetical protein
LPALIALVGVTAVRGLTFVQVRHAVAVDPLFPFRAVRFGIAVLAPSAAGRPRLLGRRGAEPACGAALRRLGGVVRPA